MPQKIEELKIKENSETIIKKAENKIPIKKIEKEKKVEKVKEPTLEEIYILNENENLMFYAPCIKKVKSKKKKKRSSVEDA